MQYVLSFEKGKENTLSELVLLKNFVFVLPLIPLEKLKSRGFFSIGILLTLLGLGLIKINTELANFNNPRPLLILNNPAFGS